jgi:murein DD-endopeptidase MepM/ murein hydrolase activator NlpD
LGSFIGLAVLASVAAAEPRVRVEPQTARAGDAVLVTVTGVDEMPRATADGHSLELFRARGGYQAVVAVPIDTEADKVTISVPDAKSTTVIAIKEHEFPRSNLAVEDDLASPDATLRARIADDNRAMLDAMDATGVAPQFAKRFVRPRGRVTSVFGEWRRFQDGHESQHLGMDVTAREGTPVHAMNRGTVTYVGETLLGGNVVIVTHGGGIASAYMHLSKIGVAVGDVVDRGAVLGRSGHTGRTTGPHLHVAIHVPGGFVDPARFFALKLAPARDTVANR